MELTNEHLVAGFKLRAGPFDIDVLLPGTIPLAGCAGVGRVLNDGQRQQLGDLVGGLDGDALAAGLAVDTNA